MVAHHDPVFRLRQIAAVNVVGIGGPGLLCDTVTAQAMSSQHIGQRSGAGRKDFHHAVARISIEGPHPGDDQIKQHRIVIELIRLEFPDPVIGMARLGIVDLIGTDACPGRQGRMVREIR